MGCCLPVLSLLGLAAAAALAATILGSYVAASIQQLPGCVVDVSEASGAKQDAAVPGKGGQMLDERQRFAEIVFAKDSIGMPTPAQRVQVAGRGGGTCEPSSQAPESAAQRMLTIY